MKKILLLLILLPTLAFGQRSGGMEMFRKFETFADVYRQLEMYYVDTLSADTVIRWAIDGMLSRVDPYTSYYPSSDDDELTQMTTGKYAGIGSVIRWHKGYKRACISEPYVGTPSEKAGLRAGDVLLSIDGTDLLNMPTADVTKRLRGEAGTTFTLRVKRGQDTLSMDITRQNIQIPVIPWSGVLDGNVGYIMLTQFASGCAGEVRRTLLRLIDEGATSLVFDLRDNPGGSLEEAIDIISLFVPKNSLVVSTKGKMPSSCREMRTKTTPVVDNKFPLAVLIDRGSASAAEIVSGTLQDMDRAVIVGTRSYGKGLVQSVHDVPDGALKITTSRYHIPSGRCIQAYDYRHLNPDGSVGVVPDSLTHVFRTQGGREVRDGGGIKPDVEIFGDSIPSILFDLIQSDELFDYLSVFESEHPTIAPAGEFRMSDDDYQSMVDYMVEKKFSYNKRSTELLKRLRAMAAAEGYESATKELIDQLEQKLNPEITADFAHHRKIIARFVAEDLVTRYYKRAGATRQRLASDEQYEKAASLLRSGEWKNILK